MRVVERLLAEAIAGKQEFLAAVIPDRDREHAAQARKHARAPGLIAVDDHLGVGAAAKHKTRRFELAPQLHEIVDLAVEAHPHAAIGAAHRLVAGRR